jgi:hypothetical protein
VLLHVIVQMAFLEGDLWSCEGVRQDDYLFCWSYTFLLLVLACDGNRTRTEMRRGLYDGHIPFYLAMEILTGASAISD